MAKAKPSPVPSASTFALSDLARQFLVLALAERAAVERCNTIKVHEGKAAYDAAHEAAVAAQNASYDMATSINERPTRSLSDLVEKALVTREYAPRWPDGTLIDTTLPDVELTASARTSLGVLSLAGLDHVRIRPPASKDIIAAGDTEKRFAQRLGESPGDSWRISKSEDELIKLEALSHLVSVIGEAFEQRQHEDSILYIGNRMFEHCRAMRTTLFGDARKLAREGIR